MISRKTKELAAEIGRLAELMQGFGFSQKAMHQDLDGLRKELSERLDRVETALSQKADKDQVAVLAAALRGKADKEQVSVLEASLHRKADKRRVKEIERVQDIQQETIDALLRKVEELTNSNAVLWESKWGDAVGIDRNAFREASEQCGLTARKAMSVLEDAGLVTADKRGCRTYPVRIKDLNKQMRVLVVRRRL